MKVTKEEILMYLTAYSTRRKKEVSIEKWLLNADKVRGSKEYKDLKARTK